MYNTVKYKPSYYHVFSPLYTWNKCTRAWQNSLCTCKEKQKILTFWSPDVLQYTCFSLSGKALHNSSRSWFFGSPDRVLESRSWTVFAALGYAQDSQPEPCPVSWQMMGAEGTAKHHTTTKCLSGTHKTRQYEAVVCTSTSQMYELAGELVDRKILIQ